MSAGERRHEDAPKKIDERVISEGRLSWTETPESEGSVALAQERVRDVDRRPEIASGAAVERDETRDRLLCAISDTEIAKLMGNLAPPGDGHLDTPAGGDPPKAACPAAGAESQTLAGVVHGASAGRPGRSFLVHPAAAGMPPMRPAAPTPRRPDPEPDSNIEQGKTRYRLLRAISEAGHPVGEIPASNLHLRHFVQTSPQAASALLMPAASAQPRTQAPPDPDSIAEDDETRDRLLRAISASEIAGHLGGETAASSPRLRLVVQTSPQAAWAPLMPPATALPQRRVSAASATPMAIEAAAAQVAVPQATSIAVSEVSSPPPPVMVPEPAPAIESPNQAAPAQDRAKETAKQTTGRTTKGTTILVLCGGEANRVGAKLARNAKSICGASWRLSARFEIWAVAKAAPTAKNLSRASWRLAVRFENWVVAIAAPTAKRLSRISWRLSVRSENWIAAKAALTAKSLGRALRRVSVELKNEVLALAALTMQSGNTAGSQVLSGPDQRTHTTQSAPAVESIDQARQQPASRVKRWFDPRRSLRVAKPPVIAYCWTADTPHPVKIADISSGGVHLLTDVRWPQGGMLSMTLQRTDRTSETPDSWIVIDFVVLRYCDDGVAGAFISSTRSLPGIIPSRAENCADEKTLKRFVRQFAVAGAA